VVFLLPFLGALLFALSFVNSQVVHLPKQMQRGLAFFPGEWDADMANDAAGSNEFRRRTWDLWAKAYFPSQPWFGRGFGFKQEFSKISRSETVGGIDYRQMVETGNIHNGLFATVDAVGIIGTIFFVVWNLRLLKRTFRVSFRRHETGGTAFRFLALYLGAWIIAYWFGAFTIGSFMPQVFAFAGVFLRLQEAMASDALSDQSDRMNSEGAIGQELAAT